MSLKDQINQDLKDAMRAKDEVRLRTVRSIRAAFLLKEKDGSHGTLSEADEIAILQKQAKQRQDSITQFRQAGREDLAAAEEAELVIIKNYLPAEMTDEALIEVIQTTISETGIASAKEMGKLMGPVMGKLRGKADGKRIQALVKSQLEQLG